MIKRKSQSTKIERRMMETLNQSVKSNLKIILDLDSTIISSLRPFEKQPKNLKGYNMDGEFIVYERPGLQDFLDFLFQNFEVAVWTAASKDYALFIIEEILLQKPERKLSFVFHSYHGVISEKISTCPKDLNLVWKIFPSFTPQNTIIIDDFEDVFVPQMCNSYPIPPFEASSKNASNDRELEKLKRKMESIRQGDCPNEGLLTKTTLIKAIKKADSSL